MLRFVPQYQKVPWGGRRLETQFGRALPEGPIGESWELVELESHESTVASGPFAGATLGSLWRDGKLGGSAQGPFPFLLKWLDTTQWLSVQVHPDEAGVKRSGKGDPKSEAWYVAHAEPQAPILLGHYPGLDEKTLRQAATGGTLTKWLYELNPRVGDMFMVKAGTLHALGPGLLILEVQQPSKTTYRVYDWGRMGLDGKPRELHVDDAVDAVAFERHGAPTPTRAEVIGPRFAMRVLTKETSLSSGPLRVFAAAGAVTLKHDRGIEQLNLGDIAVAEPSDGTVTLRGTCVFLGER
ncbi:MAG: type I phosphomannose isomerase catalytic subunit [Myxococcota bacterium]